MPTLAIPSNRKSVVRDRTIFPKRAPERRQNVRFPIALPVRYSLAKSGGWGRTVNIGSGGALLTVGQPIRIGQRIELCIGWPVLLHEKVHLTLVAAGVIVRAEEGRAAVRFERCSFRTASSAFRRQALSPQAPAAEAHV
jgi:hypothetical protein